MNINFIYILIFIIMNFIMAFIEKYLKLVKIDDFFSYLFSDITNIFLIIFYFIEKYKSKLKLEEKGIILENNLEDNYQSLFKEVSLIISSLIFKFIFNYILIVFYKTIKEIDIFDILILILMLLEIFIFKKNIYSHQIFSICMIFIILLFYLILNSKKSNFKFSYILSLLSSYSLSFNYLLIKYINTNYFTNIYLLATINGGPGTIQFLFQSYDKIIGLLNRYDDLEKILIIILYFIMMLINNFLMFKIISILNPFHPLLIDFITSFIIENIIIKDFQFRNSLLLFLSVIFCLIYLEIIILNFCGLNKNIKENIIHRGEKELVKELISDSESDNNN